MLRSPWGSSFTSGVFDRSEWQVVPEASLLFVCLCPRSWRDARSSAVSEPFPESGGGGALAARGEMKTVLMAEKPSWPSPSQGSSLEVGGQLRRPAVLVWERGPSCPAGRRPALF